MFTHATPKPDRYEIASVEKIGDNQWRFNAKMKSCAPSSTAIATPARGSTATLADTLSGLIEKATTAIE
jgi:hypothetical protein